MTSILSDDEIRISLSRWNTSVQACSEMMDGFNSLVGYAGEHPFGKAIYGVMDSYTRSVAEVVGWDYDTLTDWCVSHEFGASPMMIGFKGEPMREITTIEALSDFIIEDLRRAEQ